MQLIRNVSLVLVLATYAVVVAQAADQMVWQPNLETAQQVAAQTNRLVLIHFWSNSCAPCARLDKEVFSQIDVARVLEQNFVMVKLNWEEAPGTARLYGVSSVPTEVITTPSGRLVAQVQSPPTANQYLAQMNQAAAGYRELVSKGIQPPLPNGAVTAPPVAVTQTPPSAAPATPYGAVPTAATSPAGPSMAPPGQSGQPNDRYAEYFAQRNAAAANGAAPAGMPQQQPPQQQANQPGPPPLGLDGNCPVTLVERQHWAQGNKAWGAVHRGRTYLFLGPEEKEKFLANPDLYSPVLAGHDPVLALDNQILVHGKREFGVFGADKRIYLFADEASLKRFEQNPKRYAAETFQAQR